VGPEFASSENLGLRVLASALRAEGHQPVIIPVTSPSDFEFAARALVEDGPDVVGIGLPHDGPALLLAAFPRRLRQLGFEGPIVAGGPFATLHAEDVLSASPELDAVIRHDGEVPIVRLAEASIGRCGLEDVPGIVLRGDQGWVGGPVNEDFLGSVWPWRNPEGLPKRLGQPTATMIATRSPGHGQFGNRALASQVRRRTVQDITNEMGSLVFEYGARVFEFQDDAFLPEDPGEALLFLRELHMAMVERNFPKSALTLRVRAEQVTRELCSQLSLMGVVRAFVGTESLSKSMSRRFGRKASSIPTRVSLGRLRRLGIDTYFHSLAIGPEVTLREVEEELEALSTVRGVPFEIARVVARGGSALAHRLHQQGRLHGCGFLWKSTYEDDQVGILAELMSRISTRHFGRPCPAKRVAELSYAVALARRFHPHARLEPIERACARLVSRVNGDQVHATGALISLIRRGEAGSKQVDRIVCEAVGRDLGHCRVIGDLQAVLEREVRAVGAESSLACVRVEVPRMALAARAVAGCGGATVDATEAVDSPMGLLLESDESDTVIMEAPLDLAEAASNADLEQRCEEVLASLEVPKDSGDLLVLSDRAGARPCSPVEEDCVRPVSVRPQPIGTRLMQACGDRGSFRIIVEVSDEGRGSLIELVGATGCLEASEPAFDCLQALLDGYDLSCFAGETVVFEDQGPTE
jgi:hypothetical protein